MRSSERWKYVNSLRGRTVSYISAMGSTCRSWLISWIRLAGRVPRRRIEALSLARNGIDLLLDTVEFADAPLGFGK